MAFGGKQDVHRRRGGVQVVVEEAGQCRALLLASLQAAGELAGVATEQVMHAIPARGGGLDQMRPGQHVQRPASLRHGRPGEGRGRVRLDVRAGMQAEQPEGLGVPGGEVASGPGEYGPHLRAGVPAGRQQVQPGAQVGELAGQLGQRGGRAAGGELGRHP